MIIARKLSFLARWRSAVDVLGRGQASLQGENIYTNILKHRDTVGILSYCSRQLLVATLRFSGVRILAYVQMNAAI